MRVLIAHSRYRWSGGEETTVRNQITALEQRGHDVYLHEVDNPSGLVESAASVLVAPFNPIEYRSARQAIREFKPDVVHVHNTWFQLSPAIFRAAEIEGVPSVATIQNYRLACPQGQFFRDGAPCTDCLGTFPWSGVRHACYRGSRVLTLWNGLTTAASSQLTATVNRYVVPSRFARSQLVAAGLSEERAAVVYNGVPDPGPRSTRPSVSRTVLYVGRLAPEKGIRDFLASWSVGNHADWSLKVFGDGPSRDELTRLNIPNVEYMGRAEPRSIQLAMQTARFLVFPSQWFEVCPLVVLESFAAGLSVVGNNLGSISELLSPLGEEFLVNPSDLGGWERAFLQMGRAETVDQGGERARSLYESMFSLSRHAEALEKLYLEVSRVQVFEGRP